MLSDTESAVPGQQPSLALDFAAPTEKNIEQLKVLNRAIFPIAYQVGGWG